MLEQGTASAIAEKKSESKRLLARFQRSQQDSKLLISFFPFSKKLLGKEDALALVDFNFLLNCLFSCVYEELGSLKIDSLTFRSSP